MRHADPSAGVGESGARHVTGFSFSDVSGDSSEKQQIFREPSKQVDFPKAVVTNKCRANQPGVVVYGSGSWLLCSAGVPELQAGSSGRLLSSGIGYEFPKAFGVKPAAHCEFLEKLCDLRLGLKRRILPDFREWLGEELLLLLSHP